MTDDPQVPPDAPQTFGVGIPGDGPGTDDDTTPPDDMPPPPEGEPAPVAA